MRTRTRIDGLVLLVAVLIAAQSLANSQERAKPKDFGSSLKKLKWDASRQITTEIKNEGKGQEVDDVVRVEARLVVANLLVRDRDGKPVTGLTDKDFIVTEDDRPQDITFFSLGDDLKTARSIIFIIDHSWSQLPYMRMSVQAAKTLVDKLGPKDRMAIVGDDVTMLLSFTDDKRKMKKALEDMLETSMPTRRGILAQESQAPLPPPPKMGHSDQFSALYATVRELVAADDLRPIIIFQSDGDELNVLQPPNLHRYARPSSANPPDKDSKQWQTVERILGPRVKQYSLDDIHKAVLQSHITVYTVIPGIRFLGLSQVDLQERAKRESRGTLSSEELAQFIAFRLETQFAMARTATITGGSTSFLEEPKQAQTIYSQILADVNSRYVLAYYPANKARDGAKRTVAVQVRNHPEYTITGRKTYYAPGPD